MKESKKYNIGYITLEELYILMCPQWDPDGVTNETELEYVEKFKKFGFKEGIYYKLNKDSKNLKLEISLELAEFILIAEGCKDINEYRQKVIAINALHLLQQSCDQNTDFMDEMRKDLHTYKNLLITKIKK